LAGESMDKRNKLILGVFLLVLFIVGIVLMSSNLLYSLVLLIVAFCFLLAWFMSLREYVAEEKQRTIDPKSSVFVCFFFSALGIVGSLLYYNLDGAMSHRLAIFSGGFLLVWALAFQEYLITEITNWKKRNKVGV
jgi:hypothetical protein